MAGAFIGQVAAAELGDPVTDEVRALIRTALDEDLRYGPDVTSMATVAADAVTDAAAMYTMPPPLAPAEPTPSSSAPAS